MNTKVLHSHYQRKMRLYSHVFSAICTRRKLCVSLPIEDCCIQQRVLLNIRLFYITDLGFGDDAPFDY